MESNPVWRRSLRRRQACLPQRPPRKLGPAMRPSTGAVRWSARENSRPRSSTGCQRRVGRIPSPWRESQGEGPGIAGPLGDRSTPSPARPSPHGGTMKGKAPGYPRLHLGLRGRACQNENPVPMNPTTMSRCALGKLPATPGPPPADPVSTWAPSRASFRI